MQRSSFLERQFDREQHGTTRNALDLSFLGQQVEITAGIGTIYHSSFCHFYCAEARMAAQDTILRWPLHTQQL